jgi:hypothetical protein
VANRSKVLALCYFVFLPAFPRPARAQEHAKTAADATRFPYRFNNLVWWSDAEVRELLRRKLPTLQDQIPTTLTAESNIRTALLQILKQKGISGEVMIEDPPPGATRGPLDSGVPPPAIIFSMTAPHVVVEKVIVSDAPQDVGPRLYEYLSSKEGREYATTEEWIVQTTSAEELDRMGYLESKVDVSHDAPRRQGDQYLVNSVSESQLRPAVPHRAHRR